MPIRREQHFFYPIDWPQLSDVIRFRRAGRRCEVQPGSTDTAMNPADGAQSDMQRAMSALGYYGKPEDIAASVAFLASPAARQITGTTITIDGGANA